MEHPLLSTWKKMNSDATGNSDHRAYRVRVREDVNFLAEQQTSVHVVDVNGCTGKRLD